MRIDGNNSAPKLECGPGPATPGRIARVSLTCHCHRGGGVMKASTDSASPSECRACEAWFETHHQRDGDSQPYGGQQPFSCSEEQKGGGRKPGQPVAQARFWKFPPRPFTLENRRYRWLSRNHLGPARNPHVSLDPLSVTSRRAAIPKTGGTVKKLWRKRLPCGSPRKTQTQS